jgi:hypothetical protein
MPTDKPRIQAYIEPELYEKLKEWQQERGMKESPALNQILAEYFGVEAQSSLPTEQIEEMIEQALQAELVEIKTRIDEYMNQQFNEFNVFRVEFKNEVWLQMKKEFAIWNESLQKAEEKINEVCDYNDRLRHRIAELTLCLEPSESPGELPGELQSELPSESPSGSIERPSLESDEDRSPQGIQVVTEDLPEYCEPPSELPSEPPAETQMSLLGADLARRLGVGRDWVSRHKEKPNFGGMTRAKDPSGIAWRYDRLKQKFFPVS